MRLTGAAWAQPVDLLPEVRAPRRQDELELLATVMAFLAWALPDRAVANHSPGEGKRTRRAQGDLRRSGYQAGWPDIEVIHRGADGQGRSIFIELKAKRGVMSPEQKAMTHKLIYCGCPVHLCRSVPEVEAALRECGVPLRGSVAA